MHRVCSHCHKSYDPHELARDDSRHVEAERKAAGVDGVHLRCYVCSHCGLESLFVDLHHLAGETDDAFRRRKADLEAAVRDLHPAGAAVVVAERPALG